MHQLTIARRRLGPITLGLLVLAIGCFAASRAIAGSTPNHQLNPSSSTASLVLDEPAPVNAGWIVVPCFLVVFMHAGFALYETGLGRAKNASSNMTMNFLAYSLSAIAFFICGFAFMFGGAKPTSQGALEGGPAFSHWLFSAREWGILGGKGFLLNGVSASTVGLFLFAMVRMSIAATIPTGALAERWRFRNCFLFLLVLGALIYPVFGCWVWGGGWIAQLGTKLGWGHGGIDYAGSAVIHMQGGAIALITAWLIGPRLGKFDSRGKPRPILGHNMPMALLGGFIIAFGWFGLNVGTALAESSDRIELVAVNTALAAAGGMIAACLCMGKFFGKPDPSMMCNGMIAGLVAISAPCAFVDPWAALLIGSVAGVLAVVSVLFFEHRGIDDPVGGISVHGVGGLWGTLAVGLFANGTYGHAFNGATGAHGVAGVFYGDAGQLVAQCVLVIACIVWSLFAGGIAFVAIGRWIQPNRVPREVELAGLDVPELGVTAYPEFINPLPAASEGTIYAPRPAHFPASTARKRYSIVVEGVDSAALIHVWSSLCQVRSEQPPAQFTVIYPFVTTVTGNRFRFSGGEPAEVKANLVDLFQAALNDKSIAARIDA